MRHVCFGLALALISPTLAQDLGGAWAIATTDKYKPGAALITGSGSQYQVALVRRLGNSVVRHDLSAHWDGTTLFVGPSGASFTSLLNGGAASAQGIAKYQVRVQPPLDLERLTLVSGSIPDVQLPREVHRTTGPDHRSPAEWEQAEEILWGYRDEFKVSRIYAAAIKNTLEEPVNHWLYCSSKAAEEELEYELAQANVPLDRVRFSKKRFQTVWMRDFGPIVLKDAQGKRVVADMGYYDDRPADDYVPRQYANARHMGYVNVNSLHMEGGNYMSDGKGRIFVTTRAWEQNEPNQGTPQEHVEDRLRELGAREVLFFERMPEPEGTGHIDMFAKLVDEKTVLVGKCDDVEKFGAVLDRNAARFEKLGYKVIRLLMADGKKLMTYTNSLFVGKTVLVPVYNSPRDAEALQVYRDLGWKPVGIDARSVIAANGAIHCISMQIPK